MKLGCLFILLTTTLFPDTDLHGIIVDLASSMILIILTTQQYGRLASTPKCTPKYLASYTLSSIHGVNRPTSPDLRTSPTRTSARTKSIAKLRSPSLA
ncbi:hypothetical protein BJ912DRAFT_988030 [Pholiota molesta]|nr:hypothetical protein BJ912DRAFT_988030 [Pholiota molesta]